MPHLPTVQVQSEFKIKFFGQNQVYGYLYQKKNFGKIGVLLNVIIQELKFSKIAQLFLVCQILLWEKIWEDWEKV